jgi:hypothetical protein
MTVKQAFVQHYIKQLQSNKYTPKDLTMEQLLEKAETTYHYYPDTLVLAWWNNLSYHEKSNLHHRPKYLN